MNDHIQHQIWQIQKMLKDRHLSPALRIVFSRKLKQLDLSTDTQKENHHE